MERQDPFLGIYEKCDSGNMAQKLVSPRSFPLLCDVELGNICNFSCAMCPTGRGVLMRPKGVMSLKLLEKIVKECAANNCAIRFVRWGEPLAHPQFTDALRLVKIAGLMCHINTNGYYLDYQLACAILRIGLDSIKFSFQGTDKNGYKKWRGDHWEQVLYNLQKFHLLRGDKKKPFISVGTTITDETEEQVEMFKEFIGQFCDKITTGKTRDIITRDERGNFPECPEVWDKLSIDWDGMVTCCCADFDRFMLVGDVRTQTLKEIFNGDLINRYRKMLVEGRHNELELCRGCSANKSMQKPGGVNADIKDEQKITSADKKVFQGN